MTPARQDMDGAQAGVTLVEMLVALGVMALIGVFIAGGFAAVKNVLSLNATMTASDELALARDHLRNTISETVAQSILRQDVYFEGGRNAVTFVAAADPVFEAPGLVRVRIEAAMVDGALALIERRRIDRRDEAPETGGAVLVGAIAGVSFRYMRNGAVLDTVNKGDPLPDRIAIDLVFPPGDPRRFPPLDIPLICAPATPGI